MTAPAFPVCVRSGLENPVKVAAEKQKTAALQYEGCGFFIGNQKDIFGI